MTMIHFSRFSISSRAGVHRLAVMLLAAGALAFATPTPEARAAPEPTAVSLPVDLYDQPGGTGRVIGGLTPNADTATYMRECRADNWCQIFNNAQGRPGPSVGWVYSGPEYNSLGLGGGGGQDPAAWADPYFFQTELALASDAYDQPNGTRQQVVEAGTVVSYRCRADNWCDMRMPYTPGGRYGWVYSGPDYDALGRFR